MGIMSHEINFDGNGNIVLTVNWRPIVKVLAVLAITIASGYLPLEGLTTASRICLMIFVGAAGLWVTEAIPPFATATMVIVLCVYLLGQPEGPLHLEPTGITTSYQIFLNPIAVSMSMFSPVLGAVAIALACSLAMSLPIRTPPNAIAFATEIIETRDMARYGTIVSMIGIVVMFAVLYIAFGVFHIM